MIYKILGWVLVVVAISMIAYKETTVVDKTDVKYLLNKMADQINVQYNVPKKDIYFSTEFKKHLGMDIYGQDTLAIAMQKDLGIEFGYEEFRDCKTVGEAVDFLRIRLKRKLAREKLEEVSRKMQETANEQKK